MGGEGREEKREKRWQIRDDLGRVRHCGRGCNIFWFLVQQQNNPSNQAWDEGPIKKRFAPSQWFFAGWENIENTLWLTPCLISWRYRWRRFWSSRIWGSGSILLNFCSKNSSKTKTFAQSKTKTKTKTENMGQRLTWKSDLRGAREVGESTVLYRVSQKKVPFRIS